VSDADRNNMSRNIPPRHFLGTKTVVAIKTDLLVAAIRAYAHGACGLSWVRECARELDKAEQPPKNERSEGR